MKQISFFVVSLLMTFFVYSQQTNSSVSLTVLGNKNLQVTLDGKNYSLTNATTSGEKTTLLVENFVAGKHSFQVDRTDEDPRLIYLIKDPEKLFTRGVKDKDNAFAVGNFHLINWSEEAN